VETLTSVTLLYTTEGSSAQVEVASTLDPTADGTAIVQLTPPGLEMERADVRVDGVLVPCLIGRDGNETYLHVTAEHQAIDVAISGALEDLELARVANLNPYLAGYASPDE
jgi:hypothetical protein